RPTRRRPLPCRIRDRRPRPPDPATTKPGSPGRGCNEEGRRIARRPHACRRQTRRRLPRASDAARHTLTTTPAAPSRLPETSGPPGAALPRRPAIQPSPQLSLAARYPDCFHQRLVFLRLEGRPMTTVRQLLVLPLVLLTM